MSGQGFGSEQLWGLCPGASFGRLEPRGGELTLLLADTADLRYLYANLGPLALALAPGAAPGGGAEKGPEGGPETRPARAQVVLYERLPHVLARQVVRLALLARLAACPTLEEKVRAAHAYMEVHANLRLSDDSLEALRAAALAAQALVSPSLARGLAGEELEAFETLRGLVDLRGLLRGGDRDDLYAVCGAYREAAERAQRAAAASAAPGAPTPAAGDPARPRPLRTSLSLVRREEAPPLGLEESFDQRLRDYYGERYDVRENVSLWDLEIRMGGMLPFVPPIFFSSFRAAGLAYLRPYFRLPQALGATEPCGPVSRRAQTSEESRMYCRHENPTLASVDPRTGAARGYRGDLATGPWLEAMAGLHIPVRGREDVEALAGGDLARIRAVLAELALPGLLGPGEEPAPDPAIELYRTFQNAGPDSHESIFTGVEVAVVNLVVCGGVLAALARGGQLRLTLAAGPSFAAAAGRRAALGGRVQAAALSLEALRLIDPLRSKGGGAGSAGGAGAPGGASPDQDGPAALAPCLAPGCRLLAELPSYVCQMDAEAVAAFARHVGEKAAAEGFKDAELRCAAPPFAHFLPKGWAAKHPTHLAFRQGP